MDEASAEAVLAKRASDLDLTLSQLSALRSRISELEAQLESSRRECCKSQELNAKLQFDLHEVRTIFLYPTGFTNARQMHIVFLPHDILNAKRGYEIACRLSVCLSVTFRCRDHIGWNTLKIISLPNSDKIVMWRFLCNRRLILHLHTIFRALIYWAHCVVIFARAWFFVSFQIKSNFGPLLEILNRIEYFCPSH